MTIQTILLFFALTWGLGFSLTRFIQNSDNFWERNLMRLGIGLAAFVVLGTILSFFRIPIDWRIFLAVALIIPLFTLLRDKSKAFSGIDLRLTTTNLTIIAVIVIFAVSFFMYLNGAFKYPWLEDDDPWSHALGAKYVAVEKSIHKPADYGFQYLDPYPPGYDMLMGVLHQTNDSVSRTLKFFNALIISLSLIFFFFFAKELMQDAAKALFSTFALATIPAFFSHFIWATALSVTLFFVAFYSAQKSVNDKKWILPATISVAAIMLSQPSTAVIFGFMYAVYWLVSSVISRNISINLLISAFSGILISIILWWGRLFLQYGSFDSLIRALGLTGSVLRQGTVLRKYIFSDFFFAKAQNMINNPVGLGIVISLLGILALALILINLKANLKKRHYLIVFLALVAFTFLGVNGARLPVNFFAFRFWMLFAFSISLILPEAMWFLVAVFRKFKVPTAVTISVIVIAIAWTSFVPKYELNTAVWNPGARFIYPQDNPSEEIDGYAWLRTLPDNTKVISFEDDAITVGFDKFVCGWCPEVVDFKSRAYDMTAEEIHSWMKNNNYEYITFGSQELRKLGAEALTEKLNGLADSGLFTLVNKNRIVVIFQAV